MEGGEKEEEEAEKEEKEVTQKEDEGMRRGIKRWGKRRAKRRWRRKGSRRGQSKRSVRLFPTILQTSSTYQLQYSINKGESVNTHFYSFFEAHFRFPLSDHRHLQISFFPPKRSRPFTGSLNGWEEQIIRGPDIAAGWATRWASLER